jgi:hypothetical protein
MIVSKKHSRINSNTPEELETPHKKNARWKISEISP